MATADLINYGIRGALVSTALDAYISGGNIMASVRGLGSTRGLTRTVIVGGILYLADNFLPSF